MGLGTRIGNIPNFKEFKKMKYLAEIKEGDRLSGIYLCKNVQQASTKNGKEYLNVTLQDKTGTAECKVWEPSDSGICDFDKLDYIDVVGDVTVYNNGIQINIKRVRKADEGEYNPADYLPVSRYDIAQLYSELLKYVDKVKEPHLKALCNAIFVEDEAFVELFKKSSAAKAVHHSFVGGLLEHTYYVTRMCDYLATTYNYLNRDLLLTAAMCHDMGKVKEFSLFPENDYTDAGQLLGHIAMGYEMIGQYASKIDGFPDKLLRELQHCILAHHGELEYGSPKKPAIAEAIALNYADDCDAKMEIMREALENTNNVNQGNDGWLGFNRFLDSNIRKTTPSVE